jgi:hypothetical protein
VDDREAKARAIAVAAASTRSRPPRGLWIAAVIVSLACVGALAIAWVQSHDEPARASVLERQRPTTDAQLDTATRSSGLWTGLIALGVVGASLIVVNRRP